MKNVTAALFCLFFGIANSNKSFAQQDSSKFSDKIQWMTYLDAFYAFDFNQPKQTQRLPFLFNHNRHNTFGINHTLAKISYVDQSVRANLGLHSGTYVNDNYIAEPKLFQMIYEANLGFSLSKQKSLWLDLGIFESHLGFESAIAPNNTTVSRSLSAESSPYYNAGATLSFEKNAWTAKILALNGWQVIEKNPGNSAISLGSLLNYETDKYLFNWSTFVGTNDPDTLRRMRYFSNLYGHFTPHEKLKLTLGFDYGIQQKNKGSNEFNAWLNLTALVQIGLSEKLKLGLRGEYFNDYNQVIIPNNFGSPTELYGFSTNLDYALNSLVLLRLEGRLLQSEAPIFERKGNLVQNNFNLLGSFVFQLSKE